MYYGVFLILKYVINLDYILVHNLNSVLKWKSFVNLKLLLGTTGDFAGIP